VVLYLPVKGRLSVCSIMRRKSSLVERIVALIILLLLLVYPFRTSAKQAKKASRPPKDEVEKIRKQVAYFNKNGKNSDLIEYLQQIEEYYGEPALITIFYFVTNQYHILSFF
jgi:hypothetical protein